jgi:hypothetical protein
VRVLIHQPSPLLLDDALDVEGLGDHRADDPEELHAAVVVAIRLKAQIDGKGADGSAVEHNRHADVTQLLFQDLRTTRRQIEECRLLADARHHDRLPAFDDLPGDSFTDANANRAGAILESFNRFDLQFAVAQQGDHAADDAVMAHERDQHALQSGFEIERARKSLADLEQC